MRSCTGDMHALCHDGVQTAALGGSPYTLLRDAIFTHPTIAEGLNVLLADVLR